MRRADIIWYWNGTSFTDITYSLGEQLASVTLNQNDILYVGHNDWLSGLYTQVDPTPSGRPSIEVETFDGGSDTWKPLPREERTDQLARGHNIDPRGYTFLYHGVVYWGTSPWAWTRKVATNSFPEQTTPPSDASMFWVRLRNTGTISVTIARLLPVLFNTYATVEEVASFIGVEDFSDIVEPHISSIRKRIRAAEDWLDQHARRSWRLRVAMNERCIFNAWGTPVRHWPIREVMRAGAWTGSVFTNMEEGRGVDWYTSGELGLIYFTRVTMGAGLPWSSVASRYLRAPDSFEMDYLWGEDFDISERRDMVSQIILKRVAAEIVMQQDWVLQFVNNPDAVPKPEKAKAWKEEAENDANELKRIAII